MRAEEILTALHSRGASVHLLEGDRLAVAPTSAVTDDLRVEIRAHKAELVQQLRTDGRPVLTTADLALLDRKSPEMVEAILNTLAAFPGARVLQ